ncbi:MAG TPA: ketoacyl-ACP synthase III [Cyclobacteriaceae bacterium]|nr:ketoacyl-ACP synthase III [Cyclobacteriaceae bacterium]HMV08735.1 ketoacyl-ACP synthase III [Cyclobacteriaceae bacterium]HMV90193.1 ketoacyl-ACP synthase III [Cyclobacteriaceae bacterium]HMW99880.1 ketoacyl-ACP synthase III [Cyclobacteriaceae bacterium]HMX49257.1 ketoacyl-ACP synthase III [Cyclobacteriaceae bacterium]
MRSVIIGTGSCIPEIKVPNSAFSDHVFFEKDGEKNFKNMAGVIEKFQTITGIEERRYARTDQAASDLGAIAAEAAITDADIDRETLDYIIVAHNFGDVAADTNRLSLVPALASRIKAALKISNPDCVAYDIPFGCPGWLEGLIQANIFIRSGEAKRCLVIGTETLSRVLDPHDKDSMIYSDGSGAVVVEGREGDAGMIAWKTQTHAYGLTELLQMGPSSSPFADNKANLYLKMNGRRVYEFALNHVPLVVKTVLDKAGKFPADVKRILIHQANDKMDTAIVERLFKLYGIHDIPENIMPMTIRWLGNSSVATLPTLLDLIVKGKMPGYDIDKGDIIIFASVGAGMNINAVLYQL